MGESARSVKKKKRRGAPEVMRDDLADAPSVATTEQLNHLRLTLRKHAKLLYVTDAHERSIEWWYENYVDSDGRHAFRDTMNASSFRRWAVEDRWADARAEFWSRAETAVLQSLQQGLVQRRVKELSVLTETMDYLTEYLQPLRHSDGSVRRYAEDHDLAGLPMFPLKFTTIERFIESLLKLEERVSLKRGQLAQAAGAEVEQRVGAGGEAPPETAFSLKEVPEGTTLRAMAKALLVAKGGSSG